MAGLIKNVSEAGGNTVVFGVCKIITNGVASITAPALDTVRVIHSLALNTDSVPTAAAINSIVGSNCFFDPGVI